ncbi:TonB-dependent receptor [Fulvivirga sp. M361]|nr:TonB-dependent receptor [Fulvivirga sp. M361]
MTIERETAFSFVYSNDKINTAKKIKLTNDYESLGELLTEISRSSKLRFKQINYNIVVDKHKSSARVKMAMGSVSGRVLDENGLPLPGATVILTETSKGAVTDLRGEFFIAKVNEGDYTLNVSYLGYEQVNQPVTVTAGQSSSLDIKMSPGVTLGNEVLVLGDRLKGQAKALNQQKTNSNITNVIAADQIGRFPDANVGDALKRVPGITMQNDQGEARDIIIRGLAPQLNSVTLNGERIPSAEGDNRRVQMDLIPSDMIQTIQVNKAVTPDMDADAIGGSVNLVTRQAPSGLRISGTAASGLNFLSEKPIWTGALVIGDRIMNDKLGVIFSASYNNHEFGSDNAEAVWIENDQFGAVIDEFDIRTYTVQRVRRSTSLNLDYKINDNHTLFLNSIYNWRDDWENRFRYRVGKLEDSFDDGTVTQLEPGLFTALGRIGRQSKGGIGSDRVQNTRLEDQRMRNISLKGEHLFSNVKLNWSGTYARASEERPDERYIRFREGDLPVTIDIRNPERPLVTSNAENQWQNLSLNDITDERQFTFEEDLNGRLDLRLPINENVFIKAGGRYRNKFKKRDNSFTEYEPVNTADFDPMINVPVTDISKSNYLVGSQYQAGYFAQKEFLGSLDLQNPALFDKSDIPEEYAPGNYTAREKIFAGYAMFDAQITPQFSLLGGLRVEHTDIDYNGFSFDVDTEEIGTTNGTDSYTNVLPGLHLKYDLSESTVLRLAWTNTIARPNYFDLVPFQQFDPDGPELSTGNPNLLPAVSMNLDLMAEKYFKSVGLVSAGAFYKDIDDFIYSRSIENFDARPLGINETDVEFETPENGGTAEIYGFEVSFQRQLDFLPGIWKGFGVYLNYTYTQSSTDGIEGREGEDLALPGTAENMFNASLSYETDKLVLRASLNFASDYIDELGGDAFNDRYYDKQTFLDLNGSYAFTPQWRFFFEVNNLTNQPLRYYQGIEERTMQIEFYNVRFNAGIKFDLFKN